ncbi:MAG TPA: glycosyltransferase family 2 protein [Acidimicrobiales bacterium]|nr:glycosyltransferase family 2 protein [Acidimicrobiales bacterium]
MKVGAVVLQYRRWPETGEVIDRLLGGSRRPDLMVVVDNASRDGSPAAIRDAYGIDVIESEDNLGYAGGMNLGTARLLDRGAEAVLLLTHDCLLAPEALAALESRLVERPSVGVVGPLTGYRSAPDTVFSAGCRIEPRTWEMVLDEDPNQIAAWKGRPVESAQWMPGSCLLIRAEALRAAGPLDEKFFLYFEEVDYQLRLRRLGWEIECVPSAVAWQEPGVIPLELWVRSRLRFLLRNAPRSVLLREFARQARRVLGEVRARQFGRAGARVRGVVRFTLGRWGPIPVERAAHLKR